MKLTSFTDYSLRVLIYLAADPDRRITISEVSETFGIPENHLTKVVHFLAREGWISTVRGKGGGMVLARPAREIVVGEVVRDTEGAAVPAECFAPGESRCAIARDCRLRSVFAQAVGGFYAVLDNHTLADIARGERSLPSVLRLHRPARAAEAA